MSFLEMIARGRPRPDQVEVSVFGPNYGECIVIHVGNDNWIIIDSSAHGDYKEPIALSYLRGLDVPTAAIKTIIVTHWHDDHCAGVSKLLAAAPAARVWIPSALTRPEFLKFALRVRKNKTAVAGNKLSEFSNVIREIQRRLEAGLVTFGFASARTSMHQLPAHLSGHGLDCMLIALSPSQGDVFKFLDRLAQNMLERRQTKRSVPSPRPNDVSIASMIFIGPGSILLGADLENSGTPTAGWEAVVNEHRQSNFGPKAALYKIAHHGSENSHNADVWQELLINAPKAVLTPWRVANGRLPTSEGIRLILDRTRAAFTTAFDARSPTRKSRPPGVRQFLRENRSIRLRSLEAPFGAVRFRTTDVASGEWQHELFGAACPVARLRRVKAFR
jgi:beta-lactamase superfamily II metal-dependent hydrolase